MPSIFHDYWLLLLLFLISLIFWEARLIHSSLPVNILAEQKGGIFTVITSSRRFNSHLGVRILTQIPLTQVIRTFTRTHRVIIIVLLIVRWNYCLAFVSLQDCNVSALLNSLPCISHNRYPFARNELGRLHTVLSYAALSCHAWCSKLLGLLLGCASVNWDVLKYPQVLSRFYLLSWMGLHSSINRVCLILLLVS